MCVYIYMYMYVCMYIYIYIYIYILKKVEGHAPNLCAQTFMVLSVCLYQ
jgi:hypothetical protein